MAAVICRDDELFDLAAWFHKHNDRHFSRVTVVSIFLYLGKAIFNAVNEDCMLNGIKTNRGEHSLLASIVKN